MQRLSISLFYFILLLLLVSACGNKEEDNAMELGSEFIKELYNVNNDPNFNKINEEQLINYQNKFSTYFTEDEFKSLANKRFFLIPKEVANKQNNKISVKNISFTKKDHDKKEENSLNFDHTFTLVFTNQEEKQVDEVEIKGQISISETDNGLKIDRYYDGNVLEDILYEN